MSEAQASSDASAKVRKDPLAEIYRRLVRAIGRLPPGDVAELRHRMRATGGLPPAFWHLYLTCVREGRWRRAEAEQRWAVVIGAMAELDGLHDPTAGLGRVLVQLKVNERRFLQLVRARGSALHDLVLMMARYLRAKRARVNVLPLVRLVLREDTDYDEKARHALARDYYNSLYRATDSQET